MHVQHFQRGSMTIRAIALLLLAPLSLAQTPKPTPPPPTLRSILLSQLRSTHTEEEWFVPVNIAVANLTPEQARWIPKSELGARTPHPPTTPSA
jgi:hypothetical protein